jgi:hypothetical protein
LSRLAAGYWVAACCCWRVDEPYVLPNNTPDEIALFTLTPSFDTFEGERRRTLTTLPMKKLRKISTLADYDERDEQMADSSTLPGQR